MIGLVIQHGVHVAMVTAASVEEAEAVAFKLFDGVGVDLEGKDVSMLVFDPAKTGGIILGPGEPPPDMTGWSADGFTG